jgi:signal transduction histidine kinase
MFALFIMSCGLTHFMSIWTLWHADYVAEAMLKVVTAGASVATAIALWPLLPRAIAVPSPAQLQAANADLTIRIAERDAALAALERANAERERAEGILRQVQRMEAVGQLTGGIAHDFNNLLMAIESNADRALRLAGSAADPRIAKALENVLVGAGRASRLTNQLLAFARQQPLDPKPHDVNALIDATLTLTRDALGADITVTTVPGRGLPNVLIDAAQLETALVNLMINARDAMNGDGDLTITTRAAVLRGRPAVDLLVSDTGSGMDEDTRSRAFEPFFTTKPVGKGTGLGLSQVYGFVEQSGGHVRIDSQPGRGTTVCLTLPAAGAA